MPKHFGEPRPPPTLTPDQASGGVTKILNTEKRAAEKVEEARRRRQARLKQAQAEAQDEIEKIRRECKANFDTFLAGTRGCGTDAAARVDRAARLLMNEITEQADKHREAVIEDILQLVCDIKPELHRNFKKKSQGGEVTRNRPHEGDDEDAPGRGSKLPPGFGRTGEIPPRTDKKPTPTPPSCPGKQAPAQSILARTSRLSEQLLKKKLSVESPTKQCSAEPASEITNAPVHPIMVGKITDPVCSTEPDDEEVPLTTGKRSVHNLVADAIPVEDSPKDNTVEQRDEPCCTVCNESLRDVCAQSCNTNSKCSYACWSGQKKQCPRSCDPVLEKQPKKCCAAKQR